MLLKICREAWNKWDFENFYFKTPFEREKIRFDRQKWKNLELVALGDLNLENWLVAKFLQDHKPEFSWKSW